MINANIKKYAKYSSIFGGIHMVLDIFLLIQYLFVNVGI